MSVTLIDAVKEYDKRKHAQAVAIQGTFGQGLNRDDITETLEGTGVDPDDIAELIERLQVVSVAAMMSGEASMTEIIGGLWFDGLVTAFIFKDMQAEEASRGSK